jgi:RND family efflux transporter MFP subunit
MDAGGANVRAADAKLQQLLTGPQDADVVAAQAALTQAQNNLEMRLTPYTAADIQAQEQAIRQAEANLAAILVPSTQSDLEVQRQAVRQAEATLALKQRPYLPSDIMTAQANVEAAEVGLATANSELAGAAITAPFDGVVSAVLMSVGETATGGTATGTGSSSAGAGTMTVVDPNRVRVDVQVDESDISQIDVGQDANVRFDALGNRPFQGQVIAIAPSGTTSQGVVGYQVSIELRNARGVRPGMTAAAEIVHTQKDGVLLVPNRAITRQGRDRTVQVVSGAGTETRKVEVGMNNDQMTEIVSGLNEGEEVALPTTSARAAVPGARAPGAGGGTFVQAGGAARGR